MKEIPLGNGLRTDGEAKDRIFDIDYFKLVENWWGTHLGEGQAAARSRRSAAGQHAIHR